MRRALGNRAWSQMDRPDLAWGAGMWPRHSSSHSPFFLGFCILHKACPKVGTTEVISVTVVAILQDTDSVHISFTVVLNGVLTGSGYLAFRPARCSPLYLVNLCPPNCSKRLAFCLAQLNLVFLSCNSAWLIQPDSKTKVKKAAHPT